MKNIFNVDGTDAVNSAYGGCEKNKKEKISFINENNEIRCEAKCKDFDEIVIDPNGVANFGLMADMRQVLFNRFDNAKNISLDQSVWL